LQRARQSWPNRQIRLPLAAGAQQTLVSQALWHFAPLTNAALQKLNPKPLDT